MVGLRLALVLLLASCAEAAPIVDPPPLDASERAAIERALVASEWEEGMSNDMSFHRSVLRFELPDRVEHRVGNVPMHARDPEEHMVRHEGTFTIDDHGTVEHRVLDAVVRRTFVIAPAEHGELWANTGYRGDGRRFHHESGARSSTSQWSVETSIAFPDRIDRLTNRTCRMRVHVTARVVGHDAATLDLDRPCTIDRSARLHRISLVGFENVEPVQVSSELSNWRYREGLEHYGVPVEDALRAGFEPVLRFDPSRLTELFHAWPVGRWRR